VRYAKWARKHTLAAVERLDAPTGRPTDATTDTAGLEQLTDEQPILQRTIQ
jgi:hypothetical protein